MTRVVAGAFAALLLAGCGGGPEPTLSAIQDEIFTPKCATAGCHNAADQGGLMLTEGSAHAELVGVESEGAPGEQRVAPGNPDASVLMKVLQGPYELIPRMPSGMPKLPQGEIDAIREWIASGAPND